MHIIDLALIDIDCYQYHVSSAKPKVDNAK